MAVFSEKDIPKDYRYFVRTPGDGYKQATSDLPHIAEGGLVYDSVMGPWTRVGARTYLGETWFGRYSYVVNDASIVSATIGNFCSIARDSCINPGNHPTWKAAQHHFTYRSVSYELGDDDDEEFFNWRRSDHVTLGHDVWVGHGATILAGVSVGTGAVIGAGAVVSKDVPDFAIVGGVPSQPIKERFPREVQDGLKELAWWDWPHEVLKDALPDFRAMDAEAFLKHYANRQLGVGS